MVLINSPLYLAKPGLYGRSDDWQISGCFNARPFLSLLLTGVTWVWLGVARPDAEVFAVSTLPARAVKLYTNLAITWKAGKLAMQTNRMRVEGTFVIERALSKRQVPSSSGVQFWKDRFGNLPISGCGQSHADAIIFLLLLLFSYQLFPNWILLRLFDIHRIGKVLVHLVRSLYVDNSLFKEKTSQGGGRVSCHATAVDVSLDGTFQWQPGKYQKKQH